MSFADYVGHIKLVNGEVPHESLVLDESEIASTAAFCFMFKHMSKLIYIFFHFHILFLLARVSGCCSGPVMKLYLWDKAALDFCEKLKATGGTAKVILVTTLNPKRFGGLYITFVYCLRRYIGWLVILIWLV